MKKFYLLFFVLSILAGNNFGQTISIDATAIGTSIPSGWSSVNNVISQPIQQSGYYLVQSTTTPVAYDYLYSNSYTTLNGVASITIEFEIATYGSGTNSPLNVDMSLDGGGTWSGGTQTSGSTPTSSTYVATSVTFTGPISSNNIKFRFYDGIGGDKSVRIRKINIKVPSYTVSYNANAGTGSQTDVSSPYAYGSVVTVLDAGTITRTGYTFNGWNTVADGSGTAYAATDTFTIIANTTLYAQWSSSGCTAPADPTGSITAGANPACDNTSLSYSGSSSTIYWQTSATGTSTANPTTSSLPITSSGTYYVRAYNSASGGCWSTNALASSAITVNTAIAIGTSPTNQSVTSPATATFSVSGVTGTVSSYQWQLNTGSGWNDIPSATSASYTTGATTVAMSGYQYRCIVKGTSPCTDVTSSAATLTVVAGPCFSSNGPSFTTSGYTIGGDADAGGSPTTTIRLASSGSAGSISTTATGVTDGNVTVKFRAKGWSASEQEVTVTLDGVSTLVTAISDAGFNEYTVLFTSVTANPTLTFSAASGKRVHIGNVKLYCTPACTPPTTQASTFGTGTINMTDAAITWTRGSGTGGVIVVARAGSAVNADPLSGTTYTASATFGSGTQIGTGNYVVYNGTGTGVTVSGLSAGTTYHFAIYEYNTTDICYNRTELTDNLTTLPANVVLSSTNPAVPDANIVQGTTNNVIYKFALTPSGGSVNLTGVTINTSGTYAASNITNFKCWYSADATFNSASDVLLSTKTATLGTGSHIFPSFTAQAFGSGSTGYIFITANLPCAATNGNTIIVNAITTSDLSFTAANKSGIAYAGGTQTIISATPSNVTALATANCQNGGVTVSWTNPTGCFDNVIVVASPTALTTAPSGNGISYTANAAYGSGTAYDGGFVVYKGTGTSANISGLTNGTNYTYTVFTRNDLNWSSGISVNCTPTIVYCSAASTDNGYEYIEGVTLNTINNTSGKSYYTNFSAVSTDLALGQTYTLSVFNGDYYDSDILIAWVDWNNDGDFTDSGEKVFQSTYGDPAPYITNITVPTTATVGSLKMRLRLFDDDYVDNYTPCGTHEYGEVEDYTLNICNPSHTVSSIAPIEGPVGTYVRITGTGLTNSTTVNFNGVASTDIQFLSSTEIIARVPSGATTGRVSINESGCSIAPYVFTVIKESGDCIGTTSFSDLIISEIYDADASNRLYVELFNPTSAAINLSTYTIKIDNRSSGDAGVTIDRTVTLSGIVQPGATFLLNLGTSSNTCSKTWDFTSGGNGINADDYIFLANGGTDVERINVVNNTGYTFKRKATASGPTTTYNSADWDILNVEDCSHLGIPPVTTNPNPVAVLTNNSACNIDLTVAITEGVSSPSGDLTYKWYYNDTHASGWTQITSSIPSGYSVSGNNTDHLIITNGTNSVYDLSNYQFYCEVTEAGSCKNVSIASNYITVARPIYRSKATVNGNWTTVTNWEMAYSVSGPWVDACDYPIANNSSQVIIQSGTKIILDTDNDIDKITVESNAILEFLPDSKLTLYDSTAGADFILSGTFIYRSNSPNTFVFDDPAGTAKATWIFNSGATFIKTNTGGIDAFRDYYEGGMSTIPAIGTWIYRYNGDGNPSTGANGYFYPDLYFENTANTSLFDFNNTLMSLTGGSANCTVYGNMFVGTTGTGQVKVYNNNINTSAMLVNGNLSIGTGSTFTNQLCGSCSVSASRDNGTGLEIKGNITNNGSLDINSSSVGVLEFSGTSTQIVQGAGTFDLYNVELDKTAQTLVDQRVNLTANNNLNFIGGIIKTSNNVFTVANPARTTAVTGYDAPNSTGTYSDDKYVFGNLERNINTTGRYDFPVGDAVIGGEAYNPVVLDITSGSGYATAKFIAGNPGSINVPITNVVCSGQSKFIEYTGMTGQGWWNMNSSSGTTFTYDIYLHPNILNVNTFPNDNIGGYKNNYRALKATTGTGGGLWPIASGFDGDECIVSNNYYEIIGSGYSGFSDFAPAGGDGRTTALPIELLSFTSTCMDNEEVQLTWITASEVNSDYFVIEKSTDAVNFVPLSTIAAQGFSTTNQIYNYSDLSNTTKVYYRLKQYDIDGKEHIFNTIYVDCSDDKSSINMYYAGNNTIKIDAQNKEGEYKFNLFQYDGKNIFSKQLNIETGKQIISIIPSQQLARGVYIIQLVNDKFVLAKKIHIE